MKQANEKYCAKCGALINIKAEICPKCGVRQSIQYTPISSEITEQRNHWITCLLLCWFLGVFGVHRFYTGHTAFGVVQLLTLGGCGLWIIIDFIIIVSGNFKYAQGNPIKNV